MTKKIMPCRAKAVAIDDYVIYLEKKESGDIEFIKTMKGLEAILYSEKDYDKALEIALDALCGNIEDVEYFY